MNERQLSDRIGNVDDRLVQQVAQMTDRRAGKGDFTSLRRPPPSQR